VLISVSQKMSHITYSGKGITFLGVEIGSQWTWVQQSKLIGFNEK
jgi:RNA-directed DNA polymerase